MRTARCRSETSDLAHSWGQTFGLLDLDDSLTFHNLIDESVMAGVRTGEIAREFLERGLRLS